MWWFLFFLLFSGPSDGVCVCYLWGIKLVAGGALQGVLIVAGQAAGGTSGWVHPVVIQLCSDRKKSLRR